MRMFSKITGREKSRRGHRHDRPSMRHLESLETRQLMSLLGISVDLPITTVLDGTPGSLHYTASAQTFDDSATPIRFITATGSVPIVGNKDFQLHIKVDLSANPSSGSALADVSLYGDVSLNNNNVFDYSGLLLTGKIQQFGYEADGAVSLYDFRFTPTGGALMAPYFTGQDIGLFITSEQSTFTGTFNGDFSGATKGVIGAIPPLPITIKGTKFQDVTGNGYSADDTPITTGVTINLFKDMNSNGILDPGDGGPVATTVTDANGNYSFTNLAPGVYFTQEVVPNGWVSTTVTNSACCANYYTDTATTGGTTFTNNFVDFNANCNCNRLCNISYVINGCTQVCDLTGNTHQGDQIEVHFTVSSGAPITLSLVSYTAPENYFNANDASQQQIFDLATGTFGPGCYTLKVQLPNSNYQLDFVCGYAIDHFGPACSNIFYHNECRFIDGDNGGCNPVFAGASSLSGFVYDDSADNNGIKETGEAGIGGVVIKLVYSDGQGHTLSLIRTTNADGSYSFKGLHAGTYKIYEYTPNGWIDGKDAAGSLGGTAGNDVISGITVPASANVINYNFGELKAACISGTVFCDRNGSGKFDSRDYGIAYCKVILTGTDDQGNNVSCSTWTDGNGNYCFSGLRPGSYCVSEAPIWGFSWLGLFGGHNSSGGVTFSLCAGADTDCDFANKSGW